MSCSPDDSAPFNTPDSMTNYYMIPTANLPLLNPIRSIPVIGDPIADLLQPDLTYLVNWGYGNPAFGYSTGPANVITPFGFLPPLSDTTALGPDLMSGTQAGVSAFASDISAMVPTSLPAMSVPNLSLSSLTGALTATAPGSGALALPAPASSSEVHAHRHYLGHRVGQQQYRRHPNDGLLDRLRDAASDSRSRDRTGYLPPVV